MSDVFVDFQLYFLLLRDRFKMHTNFILENKISDYCPQKLFGFPSIEVMICSLLECVN